MQFKEEALAVYQLENVGTLRKECGARQPNLANAHDHRPVKNAAAEIMSTAKIAKYSLVITWRRLVSLQNCASPIR